MNDFLNTSIEFIKGVGPKRAELLQTELGIFTLWDMVNHFPFRHEDRTTILPISSIQDTEHSIQLKGKVERVTKEGTGRVKRLKAYLNDGTGTIELVWFKGIDWMEKKLNTRDDFLIHGKPQSFKGRFNIVHPEAVVWDEATNHTQMRIKPIYSLTETLKKRGLDNKTLSQVTYAIVNDTRFAVQEFLPASILKGNNLINLINAYKYIHSPKNGECIDQAIHRLKFNELFNLQYKILSRKTEVKLKVKGVELENIGTHFNSFYSEHLAFDLTNAQKRVLKEIRADVKDGTQMNRLVQGDVGSGKTIVAWFAMLMAIDNGYQACLMAPTEILAQQHYESLLGYAESLNLKIALLTGSTKTKGRKAILEQLVTGELNAIIGTHALIEDPVKFHQLGMCIIDEQHRFGVAQRAKLWTQYNPAPHVLVMTATPIPRTLAMTVYGDLDVSVIDEMPPGRLPVRTVHKYKSQFTEVALFAEQQVKAGKQVYIVYPLIHESDKLDYQDLMSAYDNMVRYFPLPTYHISLVHGKLRAADKEAEMKRFKEGKTQIMMATTVIEVGVNVPNANVMIIENAERFGLSQLHQLRGRVGRSSSQAYCILLTGNKLSSTAKKRIQAMESTTDGFEIAALDMKLRGPGEIDGTRQSGLMDLNLSDIVKDEELLFITRQVVSDLLDKDPNLEMNEHRGLKDHFRQLMRGKVWRRIS